MAPELVTGASARPPARRLAKWNRRLVALPASLHLAPSYLERLIGFGAHKWALLLGAKLMVLDQHVSQAMADGDPVVAIADVVHGLGELARKALALLDRIGAGAGCAPQPAALRGAGVRLKKA